VTDTDQFSPAIAPLPDPAPAPAPRPTWPTWVEILLCSGYPSQILIGQLLVLSGIPPLTANGALSGTFVFALSIGDTIMLLSLILLFLYRRRERLTDLLLGSRPALR
jgi:hypothetical protein